MVRVVYLLMGIVLAYFSARGEASDAAFAANVAWLEGRTADMVRGCRVQMKDGTAAYPPQVGSGYAAFWLRDYAYILEGATGCIPTNELVAAAKIFLNAQRADGACVDCVRFDGVAVYKPGGGKMGENPVADGSQFTVDVAFLTWKQTGSAEMLSTETLDRLIRAMAAIPRRDKLVWIDPAKKWDRCPYGFTDTIHKQGQCLFSSLLIVEADRRLAEMLAAAGRKDAAATFKADAAATATAINEVLWDEAAGLYRAATVKCREHDVWGSAFAVWLGVASPERTKVIAGVFKKNLAGLVQKGQVRHTMPGIYWEIAGKRDAYQNGAFWGTPSGWFGYTLNQIDPPLARAFFNELIGDYRERGIGEWSFGAHLALPNGYLASATLPLAALRRMGGK